MGVDPQLMDWISDYLTGRPQYVGLKDITSDTVVSSTGAPQGTVLAPLLFTLYTSDFCYNSELCHIQKYADDTAIVGCIRDDREEEYRRLVGDFAAWCHTNHLQLNTSKTKELVIDFGRSRPRPRPVLLEGAEVEAVDSYRYLGLWIDNKLDWTTHTSHLYGKTQSRMYFLRSISKKDTSRLDKLIRRAGSVVGTKLDSLVTVAESRTLDKLLDIMDNASHPLHTVISNQRSLFSERLLLPKGRDGRVEAEWAEEEELSKRHGGSSLSREAKTVLSPATSTSSSGRILKAIPRQVERYNPSSVSWVCPGGWTCPKHLRSEASWRYPCEMPEPPQLAPLDVEEQRLYSEPLADVRAPHPISKAKPRHSTKKTHVCRLYPRSHSFGHLPRAHDPR
ncbi:hypothetical protein L3Q82_004112 [Scortum barcoo]|uniref:Uncharacterized protein n=1 Tax=Scortum barcoo TaxID=214431 RepID=A0ACB8X777_9TELE|nr:hypothetical protein L3Q82_004112 [Scortum barcoo]